MAWIYLGIAGILEVVWAYYMKLSEGFTRPVPTIITIIGSLASFWFLSLSMKVLPLGLIPLGFGAHWLPNLANLGSADWQPPTPPRAFTWASSAGTSRPLPL